MLEPEMQRVLRLALVERQPLRVGRAEQAARTGRGWIEPVARRGVVRLQTSAESQVGCRLERDCFQEIAGDRVLGQVIAVNWRIIEMQAAIRAEGRAVEVDAGKELAR